MAGDNQLQIKAEKIVKSLNMSMSQAWHRYKPAQAVEPRPVWNAQDRAPVGQAGSGMPSFGSFPGMQERTGKPF